MYIDGSPAGSHPDIKGAAFDPDSDIYVGGRCDLNSERFYGNPATNDGLIDDLRIYNYALSSGEIMAIYNDSPLVCSELPDGDYNEDCKVDLLDFAILSSDWLECPNE